QIQIDQSCTDMLAKQAPVARDLRLVIAIIRINTDLERMGDQTVNIAHCAQDFQKANATAVLPEGLVNMFSEVTRMVKMALDAFAQRDVELCHKILEHDDAIDQLKDDLVQAMKKDMESDQ